MYKTFDFNKSDSIGVICRGSSVSRLDLISSEFSECFLVGQFNNALRKMGKHLKGKHIVQVLNKCAIDPDKKMYTRMGITDLQCNFGSYFGEKLSKGKTDLYRKICKTNKWAKVHLVPEGFTARRPMDRWCTAGIFAVDLAAFFRPKNIHIIGLDFYHSPYFMKEKLRASQKINRKRADEMISNFKLIAQRDEDIDFHLLTTCKKIESSKNIHVRYI